VSVISGHNHLKRISGNGEVKTNFRSPDGSFYCYVPYTKKNPYFNFTTKNCTRLGCPKLRLRYENNKLLYRRLNIYGQTSNSIYEKLTFLLKSISDHIEIGDYKNIIEKEDMWNKPDVRIFYYLTETSKEHFAVIDKIDLGSFFDIYILIWDEKLKM